MSHDQRDTPYLDAVLRYRATGYTPFHTPGHKLGRGAPEGLRELLGDRYLQADIAMAGGVEDTRESTHLIRLAEDYAAGHRDVGLQVPVSEKLAEPFGGAPSEFVPGGVERRVARRTVAQHGIEIRGVPLVVAHEAPPGRRPTDRRATSSLSGAGIWSGRSLRGYIPATLANADGPGKRPRRRARHTGARPRGSVCEQMID